MPDAHRQRDDHGAAQQHLRHRQAGRGRSGIHPGIVLEFTASCRPAASLESLCNKERGMKVLVLGGGVIGVTTAYYLARAGHPGGAGRPPGRPGAGNQLRQRRRGVARLQRALGRPRRAHQGHQVDADDAHAPLVIWPLLDPDMWRWGAAMLANCTERAYAVNKSRMVPIAEYSRDCLKALRAETGIAYDDRAQGTLQLFRTQAQLDGIAKDVEVLQQYKRALRGARPCRLLPRGTGALAHAGKVRRRAAPARRRDGRLLPVHQPLWPRWRKALGVQFRWNTTIEGLDAEGRPDHARAHRRGRLEGRCRGAGAGQLFAAAAAAAGHPHPGLSGQGLLDHGADHRCLGRARVDHHGRDAQGGRHAAGRPHPGGRHGRTGGLQHCCCANRAVARWSTW